MAFDEIAPSLLLLMFFMSGLHKVKTLSKTIENVMGKVGVSENIARLGVYIVILIEILAPVIIIYYLITKKGSNEWKQYSVISVWVLIVFTVLVTLIYHQPSMDYYRSIPFWNNVSLIGGLLLLEYYLR